MTDVAKAMSPEARLAMLGAAGAPSARACALAAAKPGVVVKKDDLAKAEVRAKSQRIGRAPRAALKIWPGHRRFKIKGIAEPGNAMTSRFVYRWKEAQERRQNDFAQRSVVSRCPMLMTWELSPSPLEGRPKRF